LKTDYYRPFEGEGDYVITCGAKRIAAQFPLKKDKAIPVTGCEGP
jgi:hypothetical protein